MSSASSSPSACATMAAPTPFGPAPPAPPAPPAAGPPIRLAVRVAPVVVPRPEDWRSVHMRRQPEADQTAMPCRP
jgi:hypothetical protein